LRLDGAPYRPSKKRANIEDPSAQSREIKCHQVVNFVSMPQGSDRAWLKDLSWPGLLNKGTEKNCDILFTG